jgi:uncharacterized protein
MAATMPEGSSRLPLVGQYQDQSAQDLARLILSDNPLEASIGMAAINALLDVDDAACVQVNAADVIAEACPGKNLVIVGHFPFVDRLRGLAKTCRVLELHPLPGDDPADQAPILLPHADLVAITATTLINHTIMDILPHCRKDARLFMLGPSTPLTPIMYDLGFTFLSGARIIDSELAIRTIEQAAEFPQVRGVRLLTMHRKDPL